LVLHPFSGKRKPRFLSWSFCVPQSEDSTLGCGTPPNLIPEIGEEPLNCYFSTLGCGTPPNLIPEIGEEPLNCYFIPYLFFMKHL
jgi:hypothetical protein